MDLWLVNIESMNGKKPVDWLRITVAIEWIYVLSSSFFFSFSFIHTGALTINGNPRLDNNGNISLSIRERDAPVSIAPNTKNLVLNVALDREGKTGPSSVYVNVICVRRHSSDPRLTTDPVSRMHASCAIPLRWY